MTIHPALAIQLIEQKKHHRLLFSKVCAIYCIQWWSKVLVRLRWLWYTKRWTHHLLSNKQNISFSENVMITSLLGLYPSGSQKCVFRMYRQPKNYVAPNVTKSPQPLCRRHSGQYQASSTCSLVPRPFLCGRGEKEGRKGLVNNSTLTRIHGCIPAISVDEGKHECQGGMSCE